MINSLLQFSQHFYCCSVTKSCLTLWDPMSCSTSGSLSLTTSQSLFKFMTIESMMLSKHFILCHRLHFLSLTFPSTRVISNELALSIRWPKYWSFSFSISPSSEYTGLISFKIIDGFDLLAVQGILKSLHQTTVQKHQSFSTQQPSLQSNSHIHT